MSKTCNSIVSSVITGIVVCSITLLIVFGIMIFIICQYFGAKYFFVGGYHFNKSIDIADSIVYPIPFQHGRFQYHNALSSLSFMKNAINVPVGYQYESDAFDIYPVYGKSDKTIYAVFFDLKESGITILCWINLRYIKQWRCFFESQLVRPDRIYDNTPSEMNTHAVPDKNAEGKCWKCIRHFYSNAEDSMWDIWNQYLKQNTKQLVIVGHSLGGAMAPLCALDFSYNQSYLSSRDIFVYISGAPRCGDVAFVEDLKHRVPNIWNLTNTYDVITLTPPVFDKQYTHVGKKVFFSLAHKDGYGAAHLLKTYLDYFKGNGHVTVDIID